MRGGFFRSQRRRKHVMFSVDVEKKRGEKKRTIENGGNHHQQRYRYRVERIEECTKGSNPSRLFFLHDVLMLLRDDEEKEKKRETEETCFSALVDIFLFFL